VPNNEHVFYAIHAVHLRDTGSDTWYPVSGVQSVGLTTTFETEQTYQLGQLQIYADVETMPAVEGTIERVIDGTPTLWDYCTTDGDDLPGRLTQKFDMALLIYSDSQTASSGYAVAACYCSGMYLNNWTFTMPVEGVATERVTVVGNDKMWASGVDDSMAWTIGGDVPDGFFSGGETVPAVARRQDLDLVNSIFPSGAGGMPYTGASLDDHLQTITISADFSRRDIYRLGQRKPYTKIPSYPIEVTSAFETITAAGDKIDARSDLTTNTYGKQIKIQLKSPFDLAIDLGSNNKLRSIDYGGGDATGGDVNVTYNFSNFNELAVAGG